MSLEAAPENLAAEATRRNPRPLVLPEPYSGERDYTEWRDHFESVAAVNEWNDEAKLLWLRVRLTGRAQTAFKRLSDATKASYRDTLAALKERFDPESKRELHIVEFQTRRKVRGESWADLGEDLRVLADKAYPDLQEEARERLSLNRYLEQLTDPQVAFGVRQGTPKTVNEAVTATLRMESYKIRPAKTTSVGLVDGATPTQLPANETVVGAVGERTHKSYPTVELLQTLLERIERLEAGGQNKTPDYSAERQHCHGDRREQGRRGQRGNPNRKGPQAKSGDGGREGRGTVVCHRCGKDGHYARGCAVKKPQGSGNC